MRDRAVMDVEGVCHAVTCDIMNGTCKKHWRAHFACGGFVDRASVVGPHVVTCVRCIAAQLRFVQLQGGF